MAISSLCSSLGVARSMIGSVSTSRRSKTPGMIEQATLIYRNVRTSPPGSVGIFEYQAGLTVAVTRRCETKRVR